MSPRAGGAGSERGSTLVGVMAAGPVLGARALGLANLWTVFDRLSSDALLRQRAVPQQHRGTPDVSAAGGDAGFTLPEAMIAGALSLLLVLPGYVLLRRTYEVADLMSSRFRLNEQARQAFVMLGDGGSGTGGSEAKGTRGFGLVEGLRSRCGTYRNSSLPLCRAQEPSPASLRRSSQLILEDHDLTLEGDAIWPVTVTCRGVRDPLPDCTGVETRTVKGWIGSDPVLSGQGRTRSLAVTVTDPFRAQRAGRLPATATETYRTIFTLNAESDP